jgi:hypothetical protein
MRLEINFYGSKSGNRVSTSTGQTVKNRGFGGLGASFLGTNSCGVGGFGASGGRFFTKYFNKLKYFLLNILIY